MILLYGGLLGYMVESVELHVGESWVTLTYWVTWWSVGLHDGSVGLHVGEY